MFSSMYDGSLATVGPWEALVTFQQFLVLCDREGVVDITREGIARRTTIPLEIIEKGVTALELPDPHSRRANEDGRRIVRLADHRDWGWRIVNYPHYRSIRTAEERREYMSAYYLDKRKPKAQAEHQANALQAAWNEGAVLERIPLIGGAEFEVRASFGAELERLYPNVDVPATLRQIRGWCIGNPTKLKTARGIRKFITGWCERDQNGR